MNEEISYQRYLFRIVYFAILDNYSCFNEKTLTLFSELSGRTEFKDVIKLVCDNMSLEQIIKLNIEFPEKLKTYLGISKK
jgi:hypothetical protein